MKSNCLLLFLCLMCFSFTHKPKLFPPINAKTVLGKTITNEIFKGKKTIVILFHLGCPGAMYLLKDIEAAKANNVEMPQVIAFAENTNSQILQFNDTTKNEWSNMRKYFQLKPLTIDVVGECSKEVITVDKQGNNLIGAQCRELSKKIKTKSSPTIVYVNEMGEVIKVNKKGYIISSSYKETIDNINIWK